MARTGRGNGFVLFRIAGAYGKYFGPILPVAVFNLDRHGRANGFAMTHPREDVGAVLLNAHTAPAAVALLPPPELMIDVFEIDFEARGQSGYKGDEALAV